MNYTEMTGKFNYKPISGFFRIPDKISVISREYLPQSRTLKYLNADDIEENIYLEFPHIQFSVYSFPSNDSNFFTVRSRAGAFKFPNMLSSGECCLGSVTLNRYYTAKKLDLDKCISSFWLTRFTSIVSDERLNAINFKAKPNEPLFPLLFNNWVPQSYEAIT